MILEVKDLSVKYKDGFSLHPLSFSMEEGEIISVVGESGSGKTTLAKGICAIREEKAEFSGKVIISGRDIYSLSEKELRNMRQREFAIALQNSRELLNPLLTIGEQLVDIMKKGELSKEEIAKRTGELLEIVGLDREVLDKLPRELSGGMIQRVLLINTIALMPKLVILDEPTSALDISSKHKIIHLILDINKRYNIGFLVITHDFGLAEHISTNMMIFYQGHLVEQGITTDILKDPKHPYSKGLINSSMDINLYRDVWGIRTVRLEKESYTACPFYPRCTQAIDSCKTDTPILKPHSQLENRLVACNRGGIITILAGKSLSKQYGKKVILDNVDINIQASEVVSVVGESGMGKTTMCNLLSGYDKGQGEVLFENEKADFHKLWTRKKGLQMIFQDPYSAINQTMTVFEAVSEPLRLNYPNENIKEQVCSALFDTGLPETEEFLQRQVKALSGGQQQRVAIARALTMEPAILIADEPTSMLDPSSKANLLRRLKGIQNKRGLSMLMITHDLSSAMKISDKIFMLEDGKLTWITNVKELDKQFLKLE